MAKFGGEPDFQSVGRKGTQILLAEMGDNVGQMKAPEQIALLKTKPNWQLANRKSQIQELFEDRGHFFLIGAACHAELASKEHGWERLKRHVKPYVDGKLSTLKELIASALQKIMQRERLLDNARCRRVMAAYRTLAERGEQATSDKLDLWEREHSKHRDVHIAELAALQTEAQIAVPIKDAKALAKMKSQNDMKVYEDAYKKACRRKWLYLKKRRQNQKYAEADLDAYRSANKKRNDAFYNKVVAGDAHVESSRIKRNRTL